ncbi:CCKAR [Cordylochernes scorpioides]|uniref:CCKAR n=1 Tax=Cordylochernes scorpioides TaxID=51811 RepID=A0ABY6LU90_9ARAC|nr:CCKAR [Cordylochernes scorpioides]
MDVAELEGNYKCREAWPSPVLEQVFAIFLDVVLLIFPLLVLSLTFGLIARTLWASFPQEGNHRSATYSPSTGQVTESSGPRRPLVNALRSTNQENALHQKRRVIKMLLVVVMEYFICWTPLYTINTLSLFIPEAVYHGLGYYNLSLFQLLAYISACCNPITYCFMNAKFRRSFLAIARCKRTASERVSATFRSTVSSKEQPSRVVTKPAA